MLTPFRKSVCSWWAGSIYVSHSQGLDNFLVSSVIGKTSTMSPAVSWGRPRLTEMFNQAVALQKAVQSLPRTRECAKHTAREKCCGSSEPRPASARRWRTVNQENNLVSRHKHSAYFIHTRSKRTSSSLFCPALLPSIIIVFFSKDPVHLWLPSLPQHAKFTPWKGTEQMATNRESNKTSEDTRWMDLWQDNRTRGFCVSL